MIEGFSGHADRDGLLEWIGAMKRRPAEILLVHGEPEVIQKFSVSIAERFSIPTHIPDYGEVFSLGTGLSSVRTVVPSVQALDTGVRATSKALDDLQETVSAATEAMRARLRAAKTDDERRAVLSQLKTEMHRRIDAVLEVL